MEQGTQTAESRPRLLFADDHQLVLDALSLIAAPHFEVQTAGTLKEFEESVERFLPDVAVLDVRMPDGDGFDVARRILTKHPALKLMFLSMHTETAFMERALELGAKAYLSKRAPMDELLTAIRTVLGGGKYAGKTVQNESDLPADKLKYCGLLHKAARRKKLPASLISRSERRSFTAPRSWTGSSCTQRR
jgi:DNA-binding NarL/FixJ family response regulator